MIRRRLASLLRSLADAIYDPLTPYLDRFDEISARVDAEDAQRGEPNGSADRGAAYRRWEQDRAAAIKQDADKHRQRIIDLSKREP